MTLTRRENRAVFFIARYDPKYRL